tara:strand:+ start:680 stop:1966 length:1287 start_codon:yes stop_codon:yes gene_type:complete
MIGNEKPHTQNIQEKQNAPLTVKLLSNKLHEKIISLDSVFYISGTVENISLSNSFIQLYFNLTDESASVRCYISKLNVSQIPLIKHHAQIKALVNLKFWKNKTNIILEVTKVCVESDTSSKKESYEANHAKCLQLGFFDPIQKKSIKANNKNICLLTSYSSGTVWKDIKEVLKQNIAQNTILYIVDCSVGSNNAHTELSKAIEWINNTNLNLDVLAVTRGGGSGSSLNTFNTFQVCEAVFKSKIPIVTAIGHQNDTTLVDLVADKTYGTPSICAQNIITDKDQFIEQYKNHKNKLKAAKQQFQSKLDQYKHTLKNLDPKVRLSELKLKQQNYVHQLKQTLIHLREKTAIKIDNYYEKINLSSHKRILNQGYGYICDSDGEVINLDNILKTNKDIPKPIYLKTESNSFIISIEPVVPQDKIFLKNNTIY